jgi:hypothetical protein
VLAVKLKLAAGSIKSVLDHECTDPEAAPMKPVLCSTHTITAECLPKGVAREGNPLATTKHALRFQ